IGRWQLASFLCLVSMRVAFLTKSPFVLPVEDREWMMEKAEPPPHWKIWITRIVEPPLDEHWTLFSAVALPPSHKVSSDTQCTTIVIGQFCAHVLRTGVGSAFADTRESP
ncbi:MAG: hypothetical protein WBD95_06410, partial [Xanthobacteraceae bacterium]